MIFQCHKVQHLRCMTARRQTSLRATPSATNSQSMPLFTVMVRTCLVRTSQRHSYLGENPSFSQKGDQHMPHNALLCISIYIYPCLYAAVFTQQVFMSVDVVLPNGREIRDCSLRGPGVPIKPMTAFGFSPARLTWVGLDFMLWNNHIYNFLSLPC